MYKYLTILIYSFLYLGSFGSKPNSCNSCCISNAVSLITWASSPSASSILLPFTVRLVCKAEGVPVSMSSLKDWSTNVSIPASSAICISSVPSAVCFCTGTVLGALANSAFISCNALNAIPPFPLLAAEPKI